MQSIDFLLETLREFLHQTEAFLPRLLLALVVVAIGWLFQQYFNIGKGRARNFLKHRKNAKLRHLALAGVAPAVCLFLLTPFSVIFALPALAWALLCLGYGVVLGMRLRDACAAAAGIAAIAMQAGWSFGFFAGLKDELSRLNTAGPKDNAARETLKSGRMPQ